jgi:alkylhydroperoxidase family enzyme
MAWIPMISEAEAEGALKEAYTDLTEPWGGVDNIMKIHSLHLETLHAHDHLYKVVMYGRSGISRPRREMIAIVVSTLNQCHY